MTCFTKNKKEKFLFGFATSLALALSIGSFAMGENQTPASPSTSEPQSVAVAAQYGDFEVESEQGSSTPVFADGVLTISGGTHTISMATEGASTKQRIEVTGASTITLENVDIETSGGAALKIDDNATFDVTILLKDGTTNILKTTKDECAGLQKSDDGKITPGKLTIGAEGPKETGKLEATGGDLAAGIGGGAGGSMRGSINGSNIEINGGRVTAKGGSEAAGIGGGVGGTGSYITISGGNVESIGGRCAAGIGGGLGGGSGRTGSGSYITISGGIVKATGSNGGAGIGGGFDGLGGNNIEITGGEVTAIGGESTGGSGAGIGGGGFGNGSNIEITGGTVTAIGCNAHEDTYTNASAGIGGGFSGNGSNITIDGAIVTAVGGSGASYYSRDGKYFDCTTAAAIGGGGGCLSTDESSTFEPGAGSNNHLNANAILIATGGGGSGKYAKEALEGFDEASGGSLAQGIAFIQKTDSKAFTGTVYGNTVLQNNLTLPEQATLTIPQSNSLTINAEKTLTISNNSILRNQGTLTENGTITCTGNGKVTTEVVYNTDNNAANINSEDKTYRDSSGLKTYESLPSIKKDGYLLEGWYTESGSKGTKVEETSAVLPNQHMLYANWIANHGPTPDPSIDPGHGGDGSGASSKTGDPSMGGIALAILGVATTGTVILRKRK